MAVTSAPKGTTIITVRSLRSGFSGDVPVALLDDATSCYKTGFQFTQAYNRRGPGGRAWDGKIHLFSPISKSLPTGAVPMAVEALRKNGYDVCIRLSPEAAPLPVVGNYKRQYDDLIPRDYQIEAVEAAHRGDPYIGQRGVVRVPTGGGKTLITAMVLDSFQLPGLVVVHGQNLVDQTYKELCRFLGPENVGLVMAGDFKPGKYTVTSVDTLARRIEAKDQRVMALLKEVIVLVVDECHRVGGGKATFQKVVDHCSSARVRLGMSGTPMKKTQDVDLLLMSRTGTLLYDLLPTRLQDEGHLANADLLVYEITAPDGMELSYPEAMSELVYHNPARTEFIIRKALVHALAGKSILLIAGNSIDFVHALRDEWKLQTSKLKGTIPGAAFVTGGSGRERVGEAVQKLREGEISLLCNTVLFDEGTDVPSLDIVMLASPVKSFVKIMQRIGRGLRVKLHKGKLLVIDFLDSNNPYLIRHFKARLKTYESEGIFDTQTVEFADLRPDLIPTLDDPEPAPLSLFS